MLVQNKCAIERTLYTIVYCPRPSSPLSNVASTPRIPRYLIRICYSYWKVRGSRTMLLKLTLPSDTHSIGQDKSWSYLLDTCMSTQGPFIDSHGTLEHSRLLCAFSTAYFQFNCYLESTKSGAPSQPDTTPCYLQSLVARSSHCALRD